MTGQLLEDAYWQLRGKQQAARRNKLGSLLSSAEKWVRFRAKICDLKKNIRQAQLFHPIIGLFCLEVGIFHGRYQSHNKELIVVIRKCCRCRRLPERNE